MIGLRHNLLKWSSIILRVIGTSCWLTQLLSVPVNANVLTEESVRARLDETNGLLSHSQQTLDDLTVQTKVEELELEVEGLQALMEQIELKEKEVDRLVGLANAKQLKELLDRLDNTLKNELFNRQLKASTSEQDDIENMEMIKKHDLIEMMDVQRVLSGSEEQLTQWILEIAREEIEKFKETTLKSNLHTDDQSGDCLTVTDIVQDVQVALNKYSQDGIGLIDHAQSGDIVHSMTSPTYIPPPNTSELLGNVWWRKYIPEDWEELLPKGWQDWRTDLSSDIVHSLNIDMANTAPPETILEKKVTPGSCWPLEGSSGKVTIRLPYPIQVESFSLDHISWQIIPNDMFESAPKKLKVIAYPPCDEKEECGALGFDVFDPMQVAQFEYDIDGSMVQNFDSIFSSSPEARNDEGSDGSCSNEAASCTMPQKIDVAAITVEIMENYGNPDYTCLYRFRVHGEQVL